MSPFVEGRPRPGEVPGTVPRPTNTELEQHHKEPAGLAEAIHRR